jgi:hypothetical protein
MGGAVGDIKHKELTMGLLKKKTILNRAEREALLATNVAEMDVNSERSADDTENLTDTGDYNPPRRLRGSGHSESIDELYVNSPPSHVATVSEALPVAPTKSQLERVRVSADVPTTVHKLLKHYSVSTGKTIQVIIEEWIVLHCQST